MQKVLARIATVLLAAGASTLLQAASDRAPLRMDARFSGFDIIGHVRNIHPELADRAGAISHWAGYYSVNPFILERLVAVRSASDSGAVRQLAQSLRGISIPGTHLSSVTQAAGAPVADSIAQAFGLSSDTVETLLAATRTEMSAAGLTRPEAATADSPPALDLPFAAPLSWQFNGAHTFTGTDGDGIPMSSLDFTASWSQRWGDDTSADVVSAAHDGEVTVFSECFVQIQHTNGWGTRYYHLDQIPLATGDRVRAGDPLGIYAGNRLQALCSGGRSTGPHLHFSLVRDGDYTGIGNVALSGYTIHPGNESYDSDPDRMWLEKRGVRYHAYGAAIAQEPGDNAIDYRYNGMWYTPQHTGHGLNIEISEFPDGGGSRQAVFIVLYTYDDSGAANFYVGNRDFDRWRSDESLVVQLLQTAGGDLANLAPIDFGNPAHVRAVGQAELLFTDCNTVLVELSLEERTSGQVADHALELVRLIGVPSHVCEAASLPLP